LTTLPAAISCDVDTLSSIYKGYGCRRRGGYDYSEFSMGLENFSRFFEVYGIRATLFMVGNDFLPEKNRPAIRQMSREGHEIANHSLSHIQGFRFLSPAEKETEIAGMENICREVTGERPVGFRCPGWNISDDTLPILQKRGYRYDSSIFPTSLAPLLKFLHWYSMRNRPGKDRTTLGHWKYMFAPSVPYQTEKGSLIRKGESGFFEFPVTVTPGLRIPFFATFLLSTGLGFFRLCYGILKARWRPIQFQFHLSDFVSYSHPSLRDQIPGRGEGVYVPMALQVPLEEKISLFRSALEMIGRDYTFLPLNQWTNSTIAEASLGKKRRVVIDSAV
jgi:peptidoglycan-N-acetylglucosamine deacetylase